ncbi:MAG: hydrogenase maturation nickel metallochaperone HypA [Bryobacteraceae bacterium]|nr:hydrogenase maturation nickel metallochaperone HypA [Bryobacteraceae bacterium]MDW8380419.1 hydrogenase maturation nickel metallochaperone HypA [Bryobacterales bacterium]
MHEATLAAHILEIAQGEALRCGGGRIRRIQVRLGKLAGVVPEALEFAFEALRRETPAYEAELLIQRVPVHACCPVCRWEGELDGEWCFRCQSCDEPLEILSGRELQVDFIELQESAQESEQASCDAS